MNARQKIMIVAGLALILLGSFLPRGWYDALPWDERMAAPPIRGVTLLQIAFLLEGLALLWMAWRRWAFTPLSESERAVRPVNTEAAGWDLGAQGVWIGLAVVTGLGLALRLFAVGADLWLDEITPLVRYREFSALEVVTTYLSSNNHLLNTLLVKLSTAFFGEREWAVRLPAVLFGAASVPVLYWVARVATTRATSLGAALILAVSYHHVFFSQNARGYTAYLLFTLLATGFLIRGLTSDRLRDWVLYACAMLLNFASLLHSGFVFGAHIVIGLVAVVLVHRSGRSSAGLVRRLVAVFAATGFLGFQLYATMMPQAYVVINAVYRQAASGFSATSLAFVRDLLQGITEGFGTGVWLGVIPFFLVVMVGWVTLVRRHWVLAAALTLPIVLTAGFLVARGLSTSPRFFLLGLPLADLAAVVGLVSLAEAVARYRPAWGLGRLRAGAGVLVAGLAIASVASLPPYYRRPKQAYRATLEYLHATRPTGELIILIHTAEHGFRYYAERAGLVEGTDFVAVRTAEAFEAALVSGDGAVLVTMFHRALQIGVPDLYQEISDGFEVVEQFQGTVHGGTIAVWKPRGA